MKIKVLLLAFGCSMMSFGAYAQKGVDTGTPFGSGEDLSLIHISSHPRSGFTETRVFTSLTSGFPTSLHPDLKQFFKLFSLKTFIRICLY